MDELKPVWDFVTFIAGQIGTGAVIFIIGLHKEWWYMGSQYRALQSEKMRYANLAELNGKVADNGLELIKR